MKTSQGVNFVSRGAGSDFEATDVEILPDRVTLLTSGRKVVVRFSDLAAGTAIRSQLGQWIAGALFRTGIRITQCIGECDWAMDGGYLDLGGESPVRIRFPEGLDLAGREELCFRIREVMEQGGFTITVWRGAFLRST